MNLDDLVDEALEQQRPGPGGGSPIAAAYLAALRKLRSPPVSSMRWIEAYATVDEDGDPVIVAVYKAPSRTALQRAGRAASAAWNDKVRKVTTKFILDHYEDGWRFEIRSDKQRRA